MDATLEVRWFRKGPRPQAVQDWFAQLASGKESVRTDLYLLSTDPGLNVKLRAGKVQAKRRLEEGRRVRLADGVEGQAEPWRKFSFKTKAEHPLSDEDRATGLWIPVEKRRHQRTLQGDALARVLADSATERPEVSAEGVEASIELTRIRLDGGSRWWSICVETEGDPARRDALLAPVARHFFAGFPSDYALTGDDSFGYAQWLSRVNAPTAPEEDDATRPDAGPP